MSRTFERQSNEYTVPYSVRYPRVISGTCEYCGVIDNTQSADVQYKLCPHFKGMNELRCSYCDPSKDPLEVLRMGKINVAAHPNDPSKLIAWCDRTECADKHLRRFMIK